MIQSKSMLEYRAANDDFREVNQRVIRGLRHAIVTLLLIIFACLFVGAALTTIMLCVLAAADGNLNFGFFAIAGAGVAAVFYAFVRAAARRMA